MDSILLNNAYSSKCTVVSTCRTVLSEQNICGIQKYGCFKWSQHEMLTVHCTVLYRLHVDLRSLFFECGILKYSNSPKKVLNNSARKLLGVLEASLSACILQLMKLELLFVFSLKSFPGSKFL